MAFRPLPTAALVKGPKLTAPPRVLYASLLGNRMRSQQNSTRLTSKSSKCSKKVERQSHRPLLCWKGCRGRRDPGAGRTSLTHRWRGEREVHAEKQSQDEWCLRGAAEMVSQNRLEPK